MSNEFVNYYDELELSQNASPEMVKQAYRTLSKRFHPDHNHEEGAEAKYLAVQAAYEVLSDPSTRSRYDQQLNQYRDLSNLTNALNQQEPSTGYQEETITSEPYQYTFKDYCYLAMRALFWPIKIIGLLIYWAFLAVCWLIAILAMIPGLIISAFAFIVMASIGLLIILLIFNWIMTGVAPSL
ncbi:DnaJ-class molecular chaperone with C-terminal Zn finger domain (DnaJ) [Fructobacillus evanidus]|uniref:DnaJ domain-containing protein n=1 Tax=Fructobacillus evanidus TaxID=3064281 RepID=UPI002D8CBA59|nr:DnaJ-class molecular chaperone with C-terminal Zn finger domain (DnaJ) [Fructobacillus sp. LMG 32999]CAK1229351.1 DnaJ-class molecular chaperone with C-terminal Zn finger domain (DnaJ) [Fructobacillus sp. LMG 32999]CAK1231263.1 DnaJ-class molecular chaperone with C-terminal Zn finger domain (DnaJ) [Fructobacillus sp. LMG 32999]CAK1232484.1 DnaJ-class molecular chaperone with C-terminal Zn finger domain (DnaJ) [Fructobacillus sp. LMG 32999]CAK1241056.1 DnaJ-class molecular chaperone with C-te